MTKPYKWMEQSVGALKNRPVSELHEVFHKWIQLPDYSEKHGRERLFTPSRTFWLFLSQILSENSSCREAVRRFLAWLALEAERVASPNTAAYCKAWARLGQNYLKGINRQVVTTALAAETEKNLWHGHRVKVIDGSGISMPDTPGNQKVWPQPKGAKPGCSYPVIRMVARFSFATGALIALAKGRLKVHERTLFRRLWNWLEPDDVVLGDRGFCGYAP